MLNECADLYDQSKTKDRCKDKEECSNCLPRRLPTTPNVQTPPTRRWPQHETLTSPRGHPPFLVLGPFNRSPLYSSEQFASVDHVCFRPTVDLTSPRRLVPLWHLSPLSNRSEEAPRVRVARQCRNHNRRHFISFHSLRSPKDSARPTHTLFPLLPSSQTSPTHNPS